MRVRFGYLFSVLAICLISILGTPPAAAADTAKCGGDGQSPCAYAKAKFSGKACSGKDEFWDPINGGSCWSCPKSHPNRTANPVNGKNAMNKDVSKACIKAF